MFAPVCSTDFYQLRKTFNSPLGSFTWLSQNQNKEIRKLLFPCTMLLNSYRELSFQDFSLLQGRSSFSSSKREDISDSYPGIRVRLSSLLWIAFHPLGQKGIYPGSGNKRTQPIGVKFQHELGKTDLIPDPPCYWQSCKETAEQKDSSAVTWFNLDPLAFEGNRAASSRAAFSNPSKLCCHLGHHVLCHV